MKYTLMATGGHSRRWRRGGTLLGTMAVGHKGKARKGNLWGTENGGRVKVWRRQVQAQRRAEMGPYKRQEERRLRRRKVPCERGRCDEGTNLGITAHTEREESSVRKTYKTQSDANDKVWLLNENTKKALALLPTFRDRGSQQRSVRYGRVLTVSSSMWSSFPRKPLQPRKRPS